MAFVCMAKTLQLSPCLITRGGGGVGTESTDQFVGRVGDQVVLWRNKKRDSLSVVVRCSADVNGAGGGSVTGGTLEEVMRAAQPYHLLHRGSTLVVVLSSEIVESPHLPSTLEDISLLHGLGIKFVLVPGTHVQIDRLLSEKGSEPKYVGNYRITDSESLNAAMNAAGKIRIMIEAKLSPQPDLSGTRRHGDTLRWYDAVSVASGNFLAAKGGVERVHILDGTIGGVLLKELFQRDGVGTMVASNLYEGMRTARLPDLYGIKQLLFPLEESGTLIRRSHEELLQALDSFIVVEKQGEIIACAALFPFFEDKCGEVAAVAVSPEWRGRGQGDKLLDYIEKKASSLGLQMLFLLTTRTADWFVRRGFSECWIECIAEERRKRINMHRGSKYYMKKLLPADTTCAIYYDNSVRYNAL
ncbi:UNVERIFIED_CONTAM: putative amino-acid acetyltransferase NAGS1, chloroplastic [Sesamum angustifolium]|uniref:Amino-acid acetyltransferase NAGS1, chloroplastic n=1 Tax=Sesamum angustifolium TaxID=2727405 RepID=A0AAW2RMR6_9LAMI